MRSLRTPTIYRTQAASRLSGALCRVSSVKAKFSGGASGAAEQRYFRRGRLNADGRRHHHRHARDSPNAERGNVAHTVPGARSKEREVRAARCRLLFRAEAVTEVSGGHHRRESRAERGACLYVTAT